MTSLFVKGIELIKGNYVDFDELTQHMCIFYSTEHLVIGVYI